MKKQVSIIWLIISAILVIFIVALLTYVYRQHSEIKNFKEQVYIEKEREKLEEEYTAIFQEYRQYESNRIRFSNDSLIWRLDREKARVKRLLEELRNRKNIDALTIDSLQEELKNLRSNIKIYQSAIDSLDRENKLLKAEKDDALLRYQKVSQEASQLQKDNHELNEKVSLAARLDASDIEIWTLNKRGRKTNDKDKVARLKINFVIGRNAMASHGEKKFTCALKSPMVQRLSKIGATPSPSTVESATFPCNKSSTIPATAKKCTLPGMLKSTFHKESTRLIFMLTPYFLESKPSPSTTKLSASCRQRGESLIVHLVEYYLLFGRKSKNLRLR